VSFISIFIKLQLSIFVSYSTKFGTCHSSLALVNLGLNSYIQLNRAMEKGILLNKRLLIPDIEIEAWG
jgi:hypothetical protein